MDLFNDVQAGKVTLSLADYEKLKDEVQKEAVHASMMEVKATVIEEEWERTKIVNYMKQFIGYSFIATIDDINSRYIAVTTEDGISGIATYDKVLGDNYEIVEDRAKAIKRAIDIAKDNDMVLILGKGNETYEKLKDKTIYFNDFEEAEKALDERFNKQEIVN